MNKEILEYLNSAEPDFATGLALFCKYSRNESLMSWISRKHDMAKLKYELEKLSKINPTPNTQVNIHVAKYIRPDAKPATVKLPEPVREHEIQFKTFDERRTRRADLPESLQKVYDTISEDYKLRRALHEKMKMAGTDEDRASFRARLIETEDRIQSGWKQIDEYLAAAIKVKVTTEEFKESTARSYISKALKKVTLSEAQIVTLKARYQALLDHGCTLNESTTEELKKRGII